MICVMLITYDRFDVARRTLEAIASNLRCSEEVWMHIADDGSSQDYRDELVGIARSLYDKNVSITNSNRTGYGGNYNTATQIVHEMTDIVLPLEDDWELRRELQVDPMVRVLRAGIFNCVRLGYIGYTDELRGIFRSHEGMQWLELDPSSPERHVFAGHPRLETVAFEKAVGPWPEGMQQGLTEMVIADRPESRQKVAWPVDLIHPVGDLFGHTGALKAVSPTGALGT